MKKDIYEEVQRKAIALFNQSSIVLTDSEMKAIEVADFGLGDIYRTGLQLVTYINTERVCAKELALLPGQTCPEHRHPQLDSGYIGKEETFRCRFGKLFLFVEGSKTPHPQALPPAGDEAFYTVFHQIILTPGEQFTLKPDQKHWFQAGEKGAVVSEFSTPSYDEEDIFTDPRIIRIPVIDA